MFRVAVTARNLMPNTDYNLLWVSIYYHPNKFDGPRLKTEEMYCEHTVIKTCIKSFLFIRSGGNEIQFRFRLHACTYYMHVHITCTYILHACTYYMHVHITCMYILHARTYYMHVHITCMYILHARTYYMHVHITCMYILHARTYYMHVPITCMYI